MVATANRPKIRFRRLIRSPRQVPVGGMLSSVRRVGRAKLHSSVLQSVARIGAVGSWTHLGPSAPGITHVSIERPGHGAVTILQDGTWLPAYGVVLAARKEERMSSTVIPCLRYRDAPRMIAWLCDAFGFTRRAVYEDDQGGIAHAQLALGLGLIMLGSAREGD